MGLGRHQWTGGEDGAGCAGCLDGDRGPLCWSADDNEPSRTRQTVSRAVAQGAPRDAGELSLRHSDPLPAFRSLRNPAPVESPPPPPQLPSPGNDCCIPAGPRSLQRRPIGVQPARNFRPMTRDRRSLIIAPLDSTNRGNDLFLVVGVSYTGVCPSRLATVFGNDDSGVAPLCSVR